ncbi:DNA recombination protein RmuC [Tessaracoccus caeni]|uniref:DNA recombination protein RmuC n=1 Tax=Tessaracoccus caeni TaxID=3031239 RepID=UPI0023DB5680|nr:DNA recombination protein RmuC [Tessaracoccus caeni]MDF1489118.1 DNA recombination protein RmuC [Tessaracoccus caeni]
MDTISLVLLLVALLVGGVVGYLFARLSSSGAQADARTAQAKATAERDAAVRLADELKADRAAMADQFALLSQRSLEAQSAKADRTAEARMAATQQLVEPLAENLKTLTARLTEVEKERARLSAELSQQVRQVQDSGESVRREALSLATALRTPQVRGAWGEQSLRRIVEISGLTARCDFDDQQTYTASDGSRFRPDMRVNLPDSRVVFVDSKVPLAAILDAYNTDDETTQRAHIARFATHVKTHIEQLGSKSYWQLDQRSPDFVVLFLGSDEFLRLALEALPDLHDYAATHDVVLASPGLLIPLLRTISHGWRQTELAESASEVIRLGRELFDRLSTMGAHVDKLGRSLTSSVRAYNSAVSSLESRVMVSARRFNDLRVADTELKKLDPIDEPVRTPAVPEMLAYEEERMQIAELAKLADRRDVSPSAG